MRSLPRPPPAPLGVEIRPCRQRDLTLEHEVLLTSELDEQGLQVAAFERHGEVQVVSTGEVSICSPFPPHQPELGACGAHFVGLNARSLPWRYYERPAVECTAEHWQRHRPVLYQRVGLALSPPARKDDQAAS